MTRDAAAEAHGSNYDPLLELAEAIDATKMVIYCGNFRTTEVEAWVSPIGCGAGRVKCLECGGSGRWAFMEPEIPASDCVGCKGTGWVLVSAP